MRGKRKGESRPHSTVLALLSSIPLHRILACSKVHASYQKISVLSGYCHIAYMGNRAGRSKGCITCLDRHVGCGKIPVLPPLTTSHLMTEQIKGNRLVATAMSQVIYVKATEAYRSLWTLMYKESINSTAYRGPRLGRKKSRRKDL